MKFGRYCQWSVFASLFFLLIGEFHVLSSQPEKVIRLRNETIRTERAAPAQAQLLHAAERKGGLFLVQFTGPIEANWRNELAALGVELLKYVPDDAFIVDTGKTPPGKLRALPFVNWVGPYRPDHKMERSLQDAQVQRQPELRVRLLLSRTAGPNERAVVRRSIRAVESRSASRFGDILQATVTPAQLRALADSPSVLWIESVPEIKLFDEISAKIVGGDDDMTGTATLTQQLGFDGSGVRVAVADSGLHNGDAETMHPDLFGRVTAFFHYGQLSDAADEHSHGTHVAGIIAGSASIGETDEFGYRYGLGVAPGAEIIAQRIFDGIGRYTLLDNDFSRLARDAVRAGADIASNSWGSDTQGRYDLMAAEFDALVRDADVLTPGDQPYIVEFSAGNAGPGRQTVGTPAVAKNVIATGASQNDRFDFFIYAEGSETMADFSSRGPAEDGRIKPDVVAPGTWIASLKSASAPDHNAWLPISNNYMYQGGTSQSGPAVSGAAAVFVQYYRETVTNSTPSPALVKAALINSAVDLDDAYGTRPAPNMDEGWGRVDLTQIIGSSRRLEFIDQTETLSTGQTFEHRFLVASSDERLKITMAYTDVPGFPGAIPALVNDLDLEVIAPNGIVYRGNQFERGESVGHAPSFDPINNVEAVHLLQPAPGEYIVRVHGRNVVEDARADTPNVDQDFALVLSADIPFPGVGVLFFDRGAYTAPDTIQLRLVDFDLMGQPSVTVELSSDTESEGKTLLLQADGFSGAFTGSVFTVTGTPSSAGQIEVNHGDWITARYEDDSPAGTRTATARADLVPPWIMNVAVTNRFGKMVVSWTTDEPASSVLHFGTDTSLDQSITNLTLRMQHEIVLENLEPETLYYFAISTTDEAGNSSINDNNGNLFSFVSVPAAIVLLVDAYVPDDESPAIPRSAYTGPLDQTGISYEVWDVSAFGSPQAADLHPFEAVIWRINDSFWSAQATLSPEEQNAITAYLDSGGGFFMASMELLSRLGDVPFRRNVLQVEQFVTKPDPFEDCFECDEDIGVPTITGMSHDPVTSGILMNLNYSAYPEFEIPGWFTIGPDLSDTFTPTTNATSILREPWTERNVGIRFPRTGEDSDKRVVFFSFPFDALPEGGPAPNTRANLLRNVLAFLAPGVQGFGTVALNNSHYTIPSLVTVEVADSDLAGEGEIEVAFFSNTEPSGRPIMLAETVRRGLFRGFITVVPEASTPAPGELRAKNGDEIWVHYFDESNNALVRAAAVIDTDPPEISGVDAEPDYGEAWVSWFTSEPCDALVQFGESPLLGRTAYNPEFQHSHELILPGLQHDHLYYYRVVSRDRAGNAAIDDNNGELYTFRTLRPEPAPWFDNMNSEANWTVINGDFGFTTWQLGVPNNGKETSAHSPPHAWGSNLNGASTDYADTLLLSPAIDLSGGTLATLRFWHSYDFTERTDFDIFEAGQIYVTANNGRDWTFLSEFSDDLSDGWEEVEIGLSAYAGKVIRLAFYYAVFSIDPAPRPAWLIDDISIELSNPVLGTIHITNNLAQATFTVSGPVSTNAVWNAVIAFAPEGEYVVTYDPVPFYETPAPQTQVLSAANTLLTFSGNYTFADENNNGISDEWEMFRFGEVSPERTQFTDTDGDGVTDRNEFLSGTDPANPDSVLKLSVSALLETGEVQIEWETVFHHAYRLHRSLDLVEWEPLTDWLHATDWMISVIVSPESAPAFFRLEARP